jgi:hypothetical protein
MQLRRVLLCKRGPFQAASRNPGLRTEQHRKTAERRTATAS